MKKQYKKKSTKLKSLSSKRIMAVIKEVRKEKATERFTVVNTMKRWEFTYFTTGDKSGFTRSCDDYEIRIVFVSFSGATKWQVYVLDTMDNTQIEMAVCASNDTMFEITQQFIKTYL